ncbi:MAG: carbohydrate ABC transporter permease [Spirochaetales bacterium]|nr:carbohydrate ABC transporter permease [Spirochaetales bacterium]
MTRRALAALPAHLTLAVFGLIFALPFWMVFVLASWPAREVLVFPPHLWFGNGLLENWQQLLARIPFARNYFNSFGIATLSTLGNIFFCTMAGYAFAKYRFKGRDFLYGFVIATMAVPGFLNLIPFYKMMVKFGWINTWLPLVVPGLAGAFGIFLMTQFLTNSIPDELLDAARIDGLTEFGILRRIIFPLAKPGLAVLGVVTFVGSWNNFTGPLVLLPKVESTTLPVALSALNSRVDNNLGALMLGNALTLLPLIIVFVFFSKRIIAGLTAGAVKQ